VALSILLWMLGTSLSSPEGFDTVMSILDNILVKLVFWGILTALAYHIVLGIRHLIMDMGYWEELESGSQSARVAFVITGVLAVLAGVLVW
jgi:succinate dehydrogenase / fumarate reductase, cytochrome b subunit